MAILFRTTKHLEKQIDDYLDSISQGIIVLGEGIINFLEANITRLNERLNQIDELEARADHLRRDIENNLYQHSLIPEHRGDVLGLLESIDEVIDMAKETLNQFSIESPFIPVSLNEEYKELTRMACQAGETIVVATRAFFRDIKAVKDHLHKVYFFEKEADKIGNRLKRHIFQMEDLELAQKNQLRYFARHIDELANQAENVADRLSIYTIKRTI